MRFFNLLSFRLFMLIFFILSVLTLIFTYYYIKTEAEQYEEIARQCAQRTSEIIAYSTKNSMLLNQKVNTFNIIRSIVEQEAIEKISLYNKDGVIVFSTIEKEIGKTILITDPACSPCHESNGQIKKVPNEKWHHLFESSGGHRSLGYIRPINNETSCYTADCHFHKENETTIGVLRVVLSLEQMDDAVQSNRARMISTNTAITLILGITVGIFLWVWVHMPVKKLIQGTREVSNGNLEYSIENPGRDEMGKLASSFNIMTDDLRKAKREITSWSKQLENRVKDKTEELEKTQKRNLQIEKMASLGQLSATVAHELNNPIAGILTYSKLIQKKLNKDTLSEEEKNGLLKYLKMIETESARSGNIVKNMLLFSRQNAIDMKPHDLNQIIEASLDLIAHHLELHNITLVKELQPEMPMIDVDDNQIKQALLALYVNAVEAMENEGRLTVTSRWKKSRNYISVYVQDSGKGMNEEVKSQIFEPFYTTKYAVKGVGLGLSAVYAIIQKHGGEITVESQIDTGTTFEIRLHTTKHRTIA